MKNTRNSNFANISTDNLYMTNLFRPYFVLLLLVFVCSTMTQCSVIDEITGGTEVGSPSINDDPDDVPANVTGEDDTTATTTFTTIAQGTDGDLGVTARKQLLESQTELQSAWELLFPGTTAPSVDFTEFHVAFLVMGEQSTSGSSIEITGIETTDIDFDILVTETTAGSDCTVTQLFTNPYHIVQIDKSSEDLRRHFVTETVEQNCE